MITLQTFNLLFLYWNCFAYLWSLQG